MINTIDIQKIEKSIISITCDKCGKIIPRESYEFQEAQSVWITGGYGSVWGDGADVGADFCQYCFKELIDPYCRVKEADDDSLFGNSECDN